MGICAQKEEHWHLQIGIRNTKLSLYRIPVVDMEVAGQEHVCGNGQNSEEGALWIWVSYTYTTL